jgi:hypothetical protein
MFDGYAVVGKVHVGVLRACNRGFAKPGVALVEHLDELGSISRMTSPVIRRSLLRDFSLNGNDRRCDAGGSNSCGLIYRPGQGASGLTNFNEVAVGIAHVTTDLVAAVLGFGEELRGCCSVRSRR